MSFGRAQRCCADSGLLCVSQGSSVQGLSRSAFQEEDIPGDDKEHVSHVTSAKPKLSYYYKNNADFPMIADVA